MIIYSDDSGQVIWPDTDLHDPNSEKYYYIEYRPALRQNEKEYVKGVDTVVLDPPNGCMYECVSGGISGTLLEFTASPFTTAESKYQDDGTVRWKCKPDTTRLRPGDSITASTWTTSDPAITLSDEVVLSGIQTGVKVSTVPSTLKKITITNTVTVQRVSGRTEKFDKSLVITVKPL